MVEKSKVIYNVILSMVEKEQCNLLCKMSTVEEGNIRLVLKTKICLIINITNARTFEGRNTSL